MADWNLQATWEQAYRIRIGRPNKLGWPPQPGDELISYLDGRVFAEQSADDGQPGLSFFRQRFNKLGGIPSFTPATTVLVVGAGLGWLLEVMLDAGSNSAWATDISTIVHTLKTDPNVDVDPEVLNRLLDIDIQDLNVKDLFIAANAGTNKGEFEWIVTEDVLTTMPIPDPLNPPQAMIDFLDDCENLRRHPNLGGVAHFVTTADNISIVPGVNPDPDIIPNPLTFAEWISVRPSHWWVDATDGRIGGGQ